MLYQGAVDIGQGSNTVLAQICAETLGVPLDRLTLVTGDTGRTPDAGKTSASRQTFVSGRATQRAAEALQAAILPAGQCRRGRCHLHRGRSTSASQDGEIVRRDRPGRPAGRCATATCWRAKRPSIRRRRCSTRTARASLRHLCLRRTGGGGAGGRRAGHGEGAADDGGARRRPGDQPNADRGPGGGRHRPGHRHGADGRVDSAAGPTTCTTT